PLWPGRGVTTTVRLEPLPLITILGAAMRAWFEENPETIRVDGSTPGLLTVKAIGPVEVSCKVLWSAIAEIVSGLALLTVTVKFREVVLFWVWPSLTVTVMVAWP